MPRAEVPLTDTIIEDARWLELDFEAIAETAAEAVLARLGLPAAGFEIAVLACDDARIAVLNGDFRDRPRATNVLSWPSEERRADTPGAVPTRPAPGPTEDPAHLGDLALSWQTCIAEARAGGLPPSDHVTHLVVHGVLHLLGYDHETDADAALMEGLESEILGKLGLRDPYED